MSRLINSIDAARFDTENAVSSVIELRNALSDVVLGKDDESLCPSGKNIGEFLPLTNELTDIIGKFIDLSDQLDKLCTAIERERRARLG